MIVWQGGNRSDRASHRTLRPGKLLEMIVWQGGTDQTVHLFARSLRGWSGEATDRSKPSDNVPTLARVAPEP